MHADYIANPLYDNNPFIEALPPMLSGKDLIHALAVIPPYNDSDRDRSTGERLQLLSSLYEFYQPLSMTIDLYCEIYTAMQFSAVGSNMILFGVLTLAEISPEISTTSAVPCQLRNVGISKALVLPVPDGPITRICPSSCSGE